MSLQTTPVKWVEIAHEQAGQRIDNFLIGRLKGVPRSHVYRILRKGEVRVNRARSKPGYHLREGDLVRIPPLWQDLKPTPAPPGRQVLDQIDSSTLYEDDDLLIINKPSGIAVHGGSGLRYGVIEALRALRPKARFLELVHRLDRETSGCLAVAKRRSVLCAMHELLRQGRIEKRYLALLKGSLMGRRHVVELPLRKNVLQSGERVVRVDNNGKYAKSIFYVQKCQRLASLAELQPITGRTHQLRVHAANIGHPIAGDEKYGDEEFNCCMKKLGLQRLFLHARSLAFELPAGGGKIAINAPLAPELRALVDHLQMRGDREI